MGKNDSEKQWRVKMRWNELKCGISDCCECGQMSRFETILEINGLAQQYKAWVNRFFSKSISSNSTRIEGSKSLWRDENGKPVNMMVDVAKAPSSGFSTWSKLVFPCHYPTPRFAALPWVYSRWNILHIITSLIQNLMFLDFVMTFDTRSYSLFILSPFLHIIDL